MGAGVPVPASQGLAPAAFLARTRTRYAVPLSRPVTSWVAAVPVCSASSQPAAAVASMPVCTAASAATEPSPEAGAEV